LAMQQKNDVDVERLGAVTLLHIHGDITIFSESFLNQAYKDVCDNGDSKILLRFDENAYINSGGIALLIQLLAKTKKNQQVVCITGLSAHFQKIFHMVGITKFAKIYGTTDEALQALTAGA
jgi:anti-anti-sigma factor